MSTKKLLIKFAQPYPGRILLTIMLGFSGALFNGVSTALIIPVVLKIVGQEINLSNAPSLLKIIVEPFDNLPEGYRLWIMTSSILMIIIFKNLASYASNLVSSSLTRRLTADIREAGIKLLLDIDIDYYAKNKIGDLINIIGGEVSRTASAIGNVIKLIILVTTILVFVGLLLSISWQLTIVATLLLSLVTLVNQYAIGRSRQFGKVLSDMSRSYSVAVLEVFGGIRLVKATGNEEKEYKKIKKLIRDRERADFQAQANSAIITPLSEVMGITSLLVIIVLSKIIFQEQISAISTILLTYLLVLLRLLPFVSQLNSLRSSFANTSASVSIVADFLNQANKPLMESGNITYKKIEKGIHFNHINFTYPDTEQPVLQDIDLYLPCGKTLALVGSSGAGKSTIADLLPRFYDPISGAITIDDINLQEFNLQSLRKAMGIVSQDTFLFNDSIKNNIAYGKPEATEAEIIAATQKANAYEFVSKLPQGLDTIIGDRGVMLSGGQRQRLAIARALLQDPEILILDEATSALDTVSERLVQEAIDNLSRERTTLVIAHRLSTVRKADRIAVLDSGKVVELGTHEELLQKRGYYSRLYSMQFQSQTNESDYKPQKSLIRISHGIRTQLNSMIGSLVLLMDNAVENPQEQKELVTEAYTSVWTIVNAIDVFDDIVNLQKLDRNFTNQYQILRSFCEQFRTGMNPIIDSLRSLADNFIDKSSSKNELIAEAYKVAIHIAEQLEYVEYCLRN